MKKTTIAAVFLMVISTCTFAGNNINKDKDRAKGESTAAIINSTKDNVYKLHYTSSTPGKVAVNILDATGKVILVDYIRSEDGFVRPYNFQGLADGEYSIEINDHAGKTKIPVSHKSSSSRFVKTDVRALPANRKYELVMHGSFKTGVEVTIYNNRNNEIIFSDFITEKTSFSKVYDLSKIDNTALTFTVKSNDKLIHIEKF